MIQSLPYDGSNFDKNFIKEDILNKPDDSDKAYLVECD